MKCPRCLNTDPEYFYKGSRGWYCRRCISFGRAMIEEETESPKLAEIADGAQEYTLQYPLTPAQEKIAVQCAQLIDDTSVLINAACGCGKTELVVYSIAKMLKEKKKVCFAIPRRQVVLELRERLAQYFPKAKVIAVCGGHTKETDGDLIICGNADGQTMVYRYRAKNGKFISKAAVPEDVGTEKATTFSLQTLPGGETLVGIDKQAYLIGGDDWGVLSKIRSYMAYNEEKQQFFLRGDEGSGHIPYCSLSEMINRGQEEIQ